jgi:hypothetical protein
MLISDYFTQPELKCPKCNQLLPPDGSCCQHIAFYCVIGPTEAPCFQYIDNGLTVSLDEVYDENSCRKLGERLGILVYHLTETDAYHPTIIVLGVK